MHTLDGVYVTLLVLMVVYLLLTLKLYMVQFQCLMNYNRSQYDYLLINSFSLHLVRKEHECEKYWCCPSCPVIVY